MKPLEFFAWVVSKSRPKVRLEPERPPFPDRPGLYEDDIDRIAGETVARKYGEREIGPPGPRLHWLATNGPTGELLKGDERNRAAAAARAQPGPASTKKTRKAADVERRRTIAELKAKIAALKGKKK